MTGLAALTRRNCKLFFKDRGMFFTSLITPVILLVLYVTFLANVYRSSFADALPSGLAVPDALINGTVAAQLLSSLLAVSCVTVSTCSNLLMVQDRVSGARRDLTIAPVRSSVLSLSYFLASAATSLIICYVALLGGLVYLAAAGWYLSMADLLLLMLDIFLLVLFGTALSSLINCNLSTNGQASAVGTIVSSAYGFICGAYMPISSFGSGLQRVLSFLPTTYATALLRNHALRGVFAEMSRLGFPEEVIAGIRASIDCDLAFFGKPVTVPAMLAIVAITVVLLTGLYVLLCRRKNR